jgi:long-chain acyl-CoA synthetase
MSRWSGREVTQVALDVELYRRTVYAPAGPRSQAIRRLSVIDIEPEGAARTLVFLHGFGGRALQWIYQLRAFGQDSRVIAPDLRGHGLSDDPPELLCDMASLLDDLDLVLDGLRVQRPFYLVSHSFGGAIATEYALRHPEDVSGLVLIGVPTRFLLGPGWRQAMSLPDPIFDTIVTRLHIALYAHPHTLRRMHDQAMAAWRGGEHMQQLRVPTLVMLGHRDTVFSQAYYTEVPRRIPGAKQVVIPVSAHLVQLERPQAVNRAIRRFIGAQPPAQNTASTPSAVSGDQAPDAAGPSRGGRPVGAAARYAEMPWLQHYDVEVPEQVPSPKQPLHELLGNAAREFPERPAIIYFGQRIRYRELDLASNRFAHALRHLGVQAGERVAIVLPNVPQLVIAFYGTLKAGAVVVLGTPLYTEAEIGAQLRDSEARVLLALSAFRATMERACAGTHVEHIIYTDVREYMALPQRVRITTLIEQSVGQRPGAAVPASASPATPATPASPPAAAPPTSPPPATATPPAADAPPVPWQTHEFQRLLHSQPAAPLASSIEASDLAVLQYTSGTTDSPQGVMLAHGNLTVNVAQTRHWFSEVQRGVETLLCALPISHSYGLTTGMNLAVAVAASMVLLPTMRADQIVKAIKQYHPSLFPGVPALYLAIANYPRIRSYGIASVRSCISGSAPLPVEVQEAFEKLTRGRLVEGYGLTEASPVTHANPMQGERRVGSIGLPFPSTQAKIVHWQTGAPLPPGEVGELLIRGPQVMQGYWKQPEETAQALAGGWLHTGDLARMDDDGFFTIVDRKKDVILAGPYNVYPREVEEVLYEHPKVLEAAVVGVPAPEGSERPSLIKAVIVLRRGERATAEELLALCRERLDAYQVPDIIEFRTELPKNFVGKILRRLLVGP